MDPADHKQDPRHPAARSWGGRTAALQKGRTQRQRRSALHGKSRVWGRGEISLLYSSGWKVARRVGSLQCTGCHCLTASQRCRVANLELPVQKSQRERGCSQEVSR